MKPELFTRPSSIRDDFDASRHEIMNGLDFAVRFSQKIKLKIKLNLRLQRSTPLNLRHRVVWEMPTTLTHGLPPRSVGTVPSGVG